METVITIGVRLKRDSPSVAIDAVHRPQRHRGRTLARSKATIIPEVQGLFDRPERRKVLQRSDF
jgi:hypothetical protein